MKNALCLTAVLFLVLGAPLAQAQEKSAAREPRREDALRDIEIGSKQLAFEEQKSKLSFDQAVRGLQVEEMKTQLEMHRQMLGNKPPRGPGGMCGLGGMCGPRPNGFRCPFARPCVFFAICAVMHLLLAVWVWGDIKRRKMGSRIWVVVALVTGLLGTFVYALVRIGDRPPEGKTAA